MDSYCIETVDFGPVVGDRSVYQACGSVFQAACLQENSSSSDCTGLRIHAGAHIAIRFLIAHPELIEGKSICEFGCGTGIYGLVGSRGGKLVKRLVLTDGNGESVAVAYKNIENFVELSNRNKVVCQRLLWGMSSDTTWDEVLQTNDGKPYDVAIGCELMYYRTDPRELLSTVIAITGGRGLFFHSHVFRRRGQGQEIIDFLLEHDWNTLEVPIKDFVDPKELAIHPEWYSARCLMSGPKEHIQALLQANSSEMLVEQQPDRSSIVEQQQHPDGPSKQKRSAWKEFIEAVDENENGDSDSDEDGESLGFLFKKST
jgi:hypothetical protein